MIAVVESRAEAFEREWTPRIGEAATQILWRQQRFRVAMFIAVLGAAYGAPAFVWSLGGPIGLSLGLCCWTAVVAFLWWNARIKTAIAAALSTRHGQRIRWPELPVMNPRAYDRWAEKRGFQPEAVRTDG